MKHSLKTAANYFIGSVLLFSGTISVAQTTGSEIIGTWWNQEKDAQIEIYNADNTYSGKIVWLKEPNDPETGKPKLDKKNPDEKLRSRLILGSDLLHGFSFNKSEKEWTGGIIYDGREGKTYKCFLSLGNDGTLKVRGYVGASWMGLGKTNIWTLKKNNPMKSSTTLVHPLG